MKHYLFLAALLSGAASSQSSLAVNLPWSTTFNCTEWTTPSQNLSCDGLSKRGDWSTCGHYAEIVSAANNPTGDGGRGFRHWTNDGVNANGGAIAVDFSNTKEMWIRWYMKYPAGFTWSPLNYDKLLYINWNSNNSVVPEFQGSNALNIAVITPGNNYSSLGGGWTSIMGGSTGDGQWHLYEIHMKMDTNGSNGIGQFWVDEQLVLNRSDINYGNHSGWHFVQFSDNQRTPANGSCKPVDWDDIAISTTGYIGPVGGSTPPPAPTPTTPQQFKAQ